MIYGILAEESKQKEIIDRVCFGSCGKVIVGAMDGGGIGFLWPCRTESKDCPAFDREMEMPFGDIDGEPIILRKLK